MINKFSNLLERSNSTPFGASESIQAAHTGKPKMGKKFLTPIYKGEDEENIVIDDDEDDDAATGQLVLSPSNKTVDLFDFVVKVSDESLYRFITVARQVVYIYSTKSIGRIWNLDRKTFGETTFLMFAIAFYSLSNNRYLLENNIEDQNVPQQQFISLPPFDIQVRLLELYRDFSYPSFPIIDEMLLWQTFYAL